VYYSVLVFFVLFFLGCEKKVVVKNEDISKAFLQKQSFEDIAGFEDDNLELALKVFQKDCNVSNPNKHIKKVCKKSFEYGDAKSFFINEFTPYKLLNKNKNDSGLITGYYEPLLYGSIEKTDKYKYPIYKRPDDLIIVKLASLYPELKKYRLRGKLDGKYLVPYDPRSKIDGKEKEDYEVICYVDSKIDRFFLEIQGSGKIQLQDGTLINIGYADQNGRKYYPIGRKLIQDGHIKPEDMSLQAIQNWCEANPKKVDTLLNLNPSKVFFQKNIKSATGSLGTQLVAKRNIAVDRNYIPLGFPVFINTTDPITNEKIDKIVIAADTGGAIKGDIRADYFWGYGEEAKHKAGKMASKGILTILIPKYKEKLYFDDNKFLKVNL